jgi:hypothetical protein
LDIAEVASERRTQQMMSAPTVNGEGPLPKRNGPKGMLPPTWLNRTLKVEYVGSDGLGATTTAVLLDYYPAGPIFSVEAAKTLISWDRLVLCELVED